MRTPACMAEPTAQPFLRLPLEDAPTLRISLRLDLIWPRSSRLEPGCAAREAALDGRDELVWRDRLAQDALDIEMAQVHCRSRCNHDRDAARVRVRRDFLLHGETVDVGKVQIEHDEIGRIRIELAERLEPIGCKTNFEARNTKRRTEQSTERDVVLDNQDASPRFAHAGIIDRFVTSSKVSCRGGRAKRCARSAAHRSAAREGGGRGMLAQPGIFSPDPESNKGRSPAFLLYISPSAQKENSRHGQPY